MTDDLPGTTALPAAYPVQLTVDEAEGPRNRKTVGFRLILAIPILILLAALNGGPHPGGRVGAFGGAAGGLLFIATALMIIFREKYPRWWFDWNVALLRLTNRVAVYLLLLRDEYPSTDEEQSVHLDIPYPDVETELARGLPIVKWLFAIPHVVVLAFLYVGAVFVAIASWVAILVTGQLPRELFDYQVGVLRWSDRVIAYAVILTTDTYPPFRLDP